MSTKNSGVPKAGFTILFYSLESINVCSVEAVVNSGVEAYISEAKIDIK